MSSFVIYVTKSPQNKSCYFSPKVYSSLNVLLKRKHIKITEFVEDEKTDYLHAVESFLRSWKWRAYHEISLDLYGSEICITMLSRASCLAICWARWKIFPLWIYLHSDLFSSGFMIRIFHLTYREWLLFGVERGGISHTWMYSGAPKNSQNC
jgi:hypothetical protein